MTQVYPFLYVVMDHKLSCVKVSDELSFGTYKEDMDISEKTNARGHFFENENGWNLCCDARTVFVNGQRLEKNQKIELKENDEIRFNDAKGNIISNMVMVYSNSNHHSAGWRKINKNNGVVFETNVSNMEDGDFQILNDLPVFCFGNDVIYQDLTTIPNSKTEDEEGSICSNVMIDIQDVTVGNRFKPVTILKDIHIQLEPGKMYLVLGGAGAGKTTFLEAVTGMVESNSTVKYGNQDLLHDEDARCHISFAPQFTAAHYRMDDTVYHTLNDAAKLYGPDEIATNSKKRKERVMELLQMLGLKGAKNKRCSTLSGGMQKKLTVAIEVIGKSKIMLLDEPDSGVDGNKVLEIMNFLKKTADDGKIVCLISHTPDRIAHLIDGVIVFGKAGDGCGHLCFMGSVKDSKEFFDCQELEQIVNRIDDSSRVDAYIQRYESERSLYV